MAARVPPAARRPRHPAAGRKTASPANRDPVQFPDPDRLDLGRDTSGPVAVGHGIHYCLGAPLARMEADVALGALLDRFLEMSLAAPRNSFAGVPSVS